MLSLGLTLAEINGLPAWELQYWLIATKRSKGERILDLAQSIGLAFGGDSSDRMIAALIPEYDLSGGFDDNPSDAELKAQAAEFFGGIL